MLDPVPPPAPYLKALIKPFADLAHLPTLPEHIHEVLFAFILYQSIQSFISPVLSAYLFPNIYPQLNRRTRTNWDVHVVSLVQSCLINTVALWVIFCDKERHDMKDSALERVYGYTGACGMVQALACGYFVWDLLVSTRYFKIFGLGILAHAITALIVFSFGFRPFTNYYSPVFILYELSSPFLNIHWFCDKLNMTGSNLQWYNGMILLATFFGCRLIWGTWSSYCVFGDVYKAMYLDTNIASGLDVHSRSTSSIFVPRDGQLCMGTQECVVAQAEVMKYVNSKTGPIPFWLAGMYLGCNLTLNTLNFYWFGKMVETVRKRFEGKPTDEFKERRRPSVIQQMADELDRGELSGPKTPTEEKTFTEVSSGMKVIDGNNGIYKRR